MKLKYLYIAVIALMAGFASCSDDDDSVPNMVYPSDYGTFVDTRDGFEYHWVRYGNLEWMVDNAHYYINNSAYCLVYSPSAGSGTTDTSDKSLLAKWGCLYNVEGAEMACPEGWRLPTDEDWQALEKYFGMSAKDANSYGWRGNIAQNLLKDSEDSTTIHLQLGGAYFKSWVNYSSHYREWSTMAYYWTSTEDSLKGTNMYFYRKMMWNKNEVFRQSTNNDEQLFSVRYVRDAE